MDEERPEPIKIPITDGRPESEEIAEFLTKRAHCPHNFRFAMLTEDKKTHDETLYTWCEHCGDARSTTFANEQEAS